MKITELAFGGSGVCKEEGIVVFVPFTAPQDDVEIEIIKRKKRFAFGKIKKILSPSPLRVAPPCPYFTRCGGCQLQHLNYPAQLDAKRLFIEDALKRIGGVQITVPPVIPSPKQWHYRAHIRLQIHPKGQGFEAGYIESDQTTLLPVTQCPLFSEISLTPIQELLASLENRGVEKGFLRLFKTTKGKILLVLSFSPHLPQNWALCKTALQHTSEWEGILLASPEEGITHEIGQIDCTVELEGMKLAFSPFGFMQNNPEQSALLHQAILAAIPKQAKRVLDLYCGIGLTSLLLKDKEVIGIELDEETVQKAKQNALENQCDHVRFFAGKAEELASQYLDAFQPDVVLCNPPRTGLMPELISSLTLDPVPTLIYVSCMPATLARDLKLLQEGGYRVVAVQGFDMFPQTTHVETVVILEKRENHRVCQPVVL